MLMESVILLSNGQLFSEKTNITVMEILGLILFQLITIYINSWNQVTIPCLENSNKTKRKKKRPTSERSSEMVELICFPDESGRLGLAKPPLGNQD